MDDELRQRLCDRDEQFVENAFFDDTCRHFFAVDWREDDASIVEYCAECLDSDSLRAEWREDSLVIIRDGSETAVPLTDSDADRHITICALNDVLQPEYEIRYLVCSQGSDTAGFAVLRSSDWQSLEQECRPVVGENFLKLRDLPNVFTELTEEKLPVPARARVKRMINR